MLVKHEKKIIMVKKYKHALRQSHFVEKHYISFLIWKLNVESTVCVPRYKTWYWRSFYSRKKKSELKKKGFLLNLYFSLDIWRPSKDYRIFGVLNGVSQGWGLTYSDHLEKHLNIYNLIHNTLAHKQKISLMTVTKDWLSLKPKSWVTLPNFVLLKSNSLDFQLENYLLLDSRNHGFQFRITCELPTYINKRLKLKISTWYLKVLLLRGFKYPVLLHYHYVTLLNNLAYFGQRQHLPWDSTLQEDGVWQLDPIALKIIDIARGITHVYHNKDITEYLIKKRLNDLITAKDKVSRLIQLAVLEDSLIVNRLINKSLTLI